MYIATLFHMHVECAHASVHACVCAVLAIIYTAQMLVSFDAVLPNVVDHKLTYLHLYD